MITTCTATDFVNIHRNTQALETQNDMTFDNFAECLQKQMPTDNSCTVARGTEENISEQDTAEYDEMAAIKEKGLVAYIMELHEKRVREEVMELLGVTEEELAEMPPEQRAAIEKRIAEETKKRLEAESYMQKNKNKLGAIQTGDIVSALNAGIDSKAQEVKNGPLFHTIEKDNKGLIFP
ncbi:MAG: hypothetical protein PVG39_12290 [Desulfobacteraceae bacterium]|jgi:hypothetical protein